MKDINNDLKEQNTTTAETENNESENSISLESKSWIVVGIIFIVIFLIYICSLGNWNLLDKSDDPLSEKKKKAELRRKKIIELIERKKILKESLERKFKWTYFAVRLVLAVIYLASCFFSFHFFKGQSLDDFLNHVGAVSLVLVILHFIFYGSFSNFQMSIDLIKQLIENRIYQKYLNVSVKIEQHEKEAIELQDEINVIQIEIDSRKSQTAIHETIKILSEPH
jgi:hypothetical protein